MISNLSIYLFFSFCLFYFFAKFSYSLNLVDIPNKRKIHSKPTAYTGGVAVSGLYILSILLFKITGRDLNIILSISVFMALVGFIDDKYNLNIGGKLSLQIIPILYLVIFESLNLNSLGDYGFFDLKLGTFSIPFTLLSILFLINSFNYFDGSDGTLIFVVISVIGNLFFLISDRNFINFLIIILIPLCVFLFYNFSIFRLPKLFLGDSGSLLLGFIISFTLIFIAKYNFVHPILLAWSIQLFVYEFLSINLIRIKNKKGIFKPGQDHLHHILLQKTKSIHLTNSILLIINIFLFFIGYYIYLKISALISLIFFILFFFIFLLIRTKYLMK